MSAGKKETVSQQKVKKKKNKSVCYYSLKNTYLKYCCEFPQISYSLFCRPRPFWVLQPIDCDRNMCVCKMHDNEAESAAAGDLNDVEEATGLSEDSNKNYIFLYRWTCNTV